MPMTPNVPTPGMVTRGFGDQDWDSLLELVHAWKARCASLFKSSQDLTHSSVPTEHPT